MILESNRAFSSAEISFFVEAPSSSTFYERRGEVYDKLSTPEISKPPLYLALKELHANKNAQAVSVAQRLHESLSYNLIEDNPTINNFVVRFFNQITRSAVDEHFASLETNK